MLAERRPELKPQEQALIARLAEEQWARAEARLRGLSRQPPGRADRVENGAQGTGLFAAFSCHGDLPRRGRRAGENGQLAARAGQPGGGPFADGGGDASSGPKCRSLGRIRKLAQGLTLDWIDGAARALSQVEQGMRRNLLRSLSLDAMAVSLSER